MLIWMRVSSPTRVPVVGVLAGTVALAASLLMPSAAAAADPKAPGDFTGYGFDACVAPSQKVMDAWNLRSPYSAVGIYISGNSRYCGDRYQPNLSRTWVETERVTRMEVHPDPRRLPVAVLQEQRRQPGAEEADVVDHLDRPLPGRQ